MESKVKVSCKILLEKRALTRPPKQPGLDNRHIFTVGLCVLPVCLYVGVVQTMTNWCQYFTVLLYFLNLSIIGNTLC